MIISAESSGNDNYGKQYESLVRDFQALKDINVSFGEKLITAIIGPSGCGKSTLLRTFNRMNDLVDGVRTSGRNLNR